MKKKHNGPMDNSCGLKLLKTLYVEKKYQYEMRDKLFTISPLRGFTGHRVTK